MKSIFKILLILGSVIATGVIFIVGATIYTLATMQSDQEVARDVDISTNWLELTPKSPLKATKDMQYLILMVDGYQRDIHDSRNQIPLVDGTTANPEIEMVDEGGKSYRLRPSLLVSAGVGYTGDNSSLRQNRPYTKIRIRSDKPFRASQVIWENMNLK